jgi:hypothetical protein
MRGMWKSLLSKIQKGPYLTNRDEKTDKPLPAKRMPKCPTPEPLDESWQGLRQWGKGGHGKCRRGSNVLRLSSIYEKLRVESVASVHVVIFTIKCRGTFKCSVIYQTHNLP